ncbi:MAG: hypothetical protein EOO03_07595 [Chitinophagaceae bacterium]|nr:MAG: hypothetical protein EOO03_07595 [Chitinophagaceae bacterium]
MKFLQLLAVIIIGFNLVSCEAIQKATNTTGSTFSLTGKWKLASNSPENVLVGSVVTVTPVLSEGRLSTMNGTGNCLRQSDVVWKSIAADNAGGFTISNLVSGCNGLNFQPANIYVINTDEVRLTGKNANGQDITQVWQRVK